MARRKRARQLRGREHPRVARSRARARGARADPLGAAPRARRARPAGPRRQALTFEARWFDAARATADTIVDRFADRAGGGFFQTSSDQERLVARRKELEDNPIPSGPSSAAFGLLRLAALTGDTRYEEDAAGVLALAGELARRHPQSFGHLLQALDFHRAAVREVALVGADLAPLARVVHGAFGPHVVVAGGDGSDAGGVPLLEDRSTRDRRAVAHVCERFACKRRVSEPSELEALLTAPA